MENYQKFYRMKCSTFSPAGGAVNIHLPSHVLHVNHAPVLEFISTLIVKGQVRATSQIYFHDGCGIDHTQLGGVNFHCPARQDKIQLLLCANLTLEELILTVATVKLCFVSQSGLF